MNNYDDVGEAQVTQVGEEFKPGIEADIELYQMLGIDCGTFGGELMTQAEPEWAKAASLCEDDIATIELLERFEVVPFILPTVKLKERKFAQRYTALFEYKDVLYITAPFERESHAAACVLWFVLSLSQS